MKIVKTILIVVLFFLTVTFSLQNTENVGLHYYGVTEPFSAPLFTVVLAAVLLGVIIGGFGGLLTNLKLRMDVRKQAREMERLGTELKRAQEQLPSPQDAPTVPPMTS